MIDQLSMDLVRKRLVTDAVEVLLGYDHTGIPAAYDGVLVRNPYGKAVPKPVHGLVHLGRQTASARLMTEAAASVFDRCADPELLIRRINVVAHNVVPEEQAEEPAVQYGLFEDTEEAARRRAQEHTRLAREHALQEAMLSIRCRFGKNAVLRGMNFREGATARDRNRQVGGHRA